MKNEIMKSLVKKIANSELGILLRNSINFKPILSIMKNHFLTVSDCFLWRTDNGFKTKFSADILNLFYR